MPPDNLTFALREIRPGDQCAGFSMGDAAFAPLKAFLRQHALQHHTADLSKTYGLFEDGERPRPRAYITIVCSEIAIDGDSPKVEDAEYPYPDYPAVKIAKLAVQDGYRGREMGRRLVEFALAQVKAHVCPRVGCRFVVVDSKVGSVEFYRRCGFTFLDTAHNERRDNPILFVDLRKITAAK